MRTTTKIAIALLVAGAAVAWPADQALAQGPSRIVIPMGGVGYYLFASRGWTESQRYDLRTFVQNYYYYPLDRVSVGPPLGPASYGYRATRTRSPRRMPSARLASEMSLISPRLVYFGPGNYYGQSSSLMRRIRHVTLAHRVEAGTNSPALRMTPRAVGH